MTTTISGKATRRGISEANTESVASTASDNIAPITQREGRHSSRQLTDPLDE